MTTIRERAFAVYVSAEERRAETAAAQRRADAERDRAERLRQLVCGLDRVFADIAVDRAETPEENARRIAREADLMIDLDSGWADLGDSIVVCGWENRYGHSLVLGARCAWCGAVGRRENEEHGGLSFSFTGIEGLGWHVAHGTLDQPWTCPDCEAQARREQEERIDARLEAEEASSPEWPAPAPQPLPADERIAAALEGILRFLVQDVIDVRTEAGRL